jgi:hypothetical protein
MSNHRQGEACAPKFQLGRAVITRGADDVVRRFHVSPLELLTRHACGDWGSVDEEDVAANERALVEGTRLLSVYVLSGSRVNQSSLMSEHPGNATVWVITEADRSSTTLLLPEEY